MARLEGDVFCFLLVDPTPVAPCKVAQKLQKDRLGDSFSVGRSTVNPAAVKIYVQRTRFTGPIKTANLQLPDVKSRLNPFVSCIHGTFIAFYRRWRAFIDLIYAVAEEAVMQTPIPIANEETNIEILARIAKATSKKWGCTMHIDFYNGNRTVIFSGDPEYRSCIVYELTDILDKCNQTGEKYDSLS